MKPLTLNTKVGLPSATFLLSLIAPLASAQSANNDIETVVVTGTRTPHTLAATPIEVDVISLEEIKRSGAVTLDELLLTETGVHVTPEAGRANRLEIQGFSSERVLVLLNGQRINGRISGAIDLSRVKTANIKQIEIVKGASSALYGSDAMGGVINIITDIEEDGLRLQTRGDDEGGYFASLRGSINRDSFRGDATGGFINTPDYDLNENDRDRDGVISEAGFFQTNGEWDLSESAELAIRADYQLDDQSRLQESNGGGIVDINKQVEEWRVSVEPRWRLERGTVKTYAYHTSYFDQFVQEQRGTDQNDIDEETTDTLSVAGGQYDLPLGDHFLTTGIEYQYNKLESDRLTDSISRDIYSLYIQDDWVVNDWLTLVPGLRHDEDSEFGGATSPKIAVRIDASDNLVFRGSYGHGFRAPSFKELALRFENPSVGYRVDGNPDLEAESSDSVNLGFTWQGSPRWELGLSIFHTEADDLIEVIQTTSSGLLLFTYRNVSEATLEGADAHLSFQPTDNWELTLNYSLLDTEDEATGEELSGRAEHRVGLKTAFTLGRVELSASAQWVGERTFLTTIQDGPPVPGGDADAYTLADARIAWQASSDALMAIGIENILDEGDDRFLPIRPRHAYLSFEWTLL